MSNRRIETFDSTSRDGAQGEDTSFSLEDKIGVAVVSDDMGISYIKAENPGSNPKDMEFFKRMKEVDLENSKLVTFGATRKANIKVEDDINIRSLIKAETDVIVIPGKAWDFQVKEILKTSLQENVNMINDSIKYIKNKSKEVISDVEYLSDGYKENKAYAMEAINTAKETGANVIVLCDTNGGTLPSEIRDISEDVMKSIDGRVGIHCHNDIRMVIPNLIIVVEEGICRVQGTFIGVGERCGNANSSAIIPTLQLKMGFEAIPQERLANLTKASRFISEISNISLSDNMPCIGALAFAYKGGMHIDAVCKSSKSYEHIKPEPIGNDRRFLVSEVSGKSTILKEIQKNLPDITEESEEVEKVTNKLKELEYEGYRFEGTEGMVELLIKKAIGKYKPFFKLNHFKTIGEQSLNNKYFTSAALINITVDGKNRMAASEGDGPVNVLDKALKEALESFYPQLKEVRLVDYKARVLDSESATGTKIRVPTESTDGIESWSTVGVSRDVVQTSQIALADSLEYKLIKDTEKTVRMYFQKRDYKMGMIMTQKILAAHTGLESVKAGQLIEANLDLVLDNNITSPVAIKELNKLNLDKVFNRDKIAIVSDHFIPNKDIKVTEQCKFVRELVGEKEITNFFEVGEMRTERCLIPEKGLTVAGDIIVGVDSHTCTYGALGAFSIGIGPTDTAAGMATGKCWFKVPLAIKLVLKNKPSKRVGGKDVILHIIGMIDVDGVLYRSMEFVGSGLKYLSVNDRFTMANMAIEADGRNGIFPVDDVIIRYLVGHAQREWEVHEADEDTEYDEVYEIDLSKLRSTVAFPHLPDNTRTIDEVGEVAVGQVVIGSCTSGRISDLRVARDILKSKKVRKGARCIVFPGIQKTYLQALEEGTVKDLVEVGAVVSIPTCDPRLGEYMGILTKEERAIPATNRSFVGRMGHVESEVYLVSPAVAVASTLTGKITNSEEVGIMKE